MIRILSDLHWGHKASRITDIDSLRPLISDIDTVIFNGDTVEQKFEDSPAHLKHPLPPISQLKDKVAEWNSKAILITGNHDPGISNAHYCELNQKDIIVTHGDAIFDSIAPWSVNAQVLRQLVQKGLTKFEASEQSSSFYHFLKVFKEASLEEHAILKDYDPTVWGKIQIFARQAWPPTRALKVLECWNEAAKSAVEMVRRFNLSPQFLIIGHTHKPNVSKVGKTTVINTGAFLPWPGATAVDIESDGISVRKVEYRAGQFRTARIIAQFKTAVDLDSLAIPVETVQLARPPIESPFSA